MHVVKPTFTSTTVARLVDDEQDRGAQNRALRDRYLAHEAAAAAAIESGDEHDLARCLDELNAVGTLFVQYNMGLAGVLVNRYARRVSSENLDEALGACMEALWSCFITWDPDRASFGTWSRRALQGVLWREVERWEHPERTYHEGLDIRSALRAAEDLRQELQRDPTLAEVAEHCGIPVGRLEALYSRSVCSIDTPITGDAGNNIDGDTLSDDAGDWDDNTWTVLDILGTSGDVEEDVWLRALAAATVELDALGLYLVLVRKGLHGWNPENLPEIAAVTGIGREIVRRRTQKALETIAGTAHALPQYL